MKKRGINDTWLIGRLTFTHVTRITRLQFIYFAKYLCTMERLKRLSIYDSSQTKTWQIKMPVYHFTFETKNYNTHKLARVFFCVAMVTKKTAITHARISIITNIPTARRLCFVWQHPSPYGERKPVQYGAMIKSAADLSFNSNESKHDKQNERSDMRNV